MFTIEVKKKKKDEEFSFKDLEIFHKECMGGRILVSTQKIKEQRVYLNIVDLNIYVFECKRCGRKVGVDIDSYNPEYIIKTAIDGQERKIKGFIFLGGSQQLMLSWNKNEKETVSVPIIPKN